MRKPCPERNEACPYFTQRGGCFSDEHHLYWPRAEYRRGIERDFRELPENKQQTCRAEHDELHYEEPPEKPSLNEMKQALGYIALEAS